MRQLLPLCIPFMLTACGSSNEQIQPTPAPTPTPPPTIAPVDISITFNDGAGNWSAGFSDYPIADADIYELVAELAPLPLDNSVQGFRLKGSNRSDDLFMFLKTEVADLEPSTRYHLTGSMTFLTNAGAGCVGIGGAPGESVFVKLGASEIEPAQADYYLNVDKGNQSMPGNDALVVGDVAASATDCSGSVFVEKTITIETENGFEIQSSTQGQIWVFLGTDSGYEGVTDLYYTSIDLQLEVVD